MLPHVRIVLLLVLPLLFSLGSDASAQVGRLFGTVAYATPGQPTPARGVRVVAVNAYGQWEARTDSNGNFVMLLPAGSYRIVAQGALGYTTYGTVMGYVRANADNIITPNPLFLVPSRSSGYMTGIALSQMVNWREHTSTVQQNNLTLEITAQRQGVGRLLGNVTYGDAKVAKGVRVVAVSNYGQWETRTGDEGNFVMVLPEGNYNIVAQGLPGYITRGTVTGYVRANTDSSITPNPLFLVPEPKPTPTPKPTPKPTPRRHSSR